MKLNCNNIWKKLQIYFEVFKKKKTKILILKFVFFKMLSFDF